MRKIKYKWSEDNKHDMDSLKAIRIDVPLFKMKKLIEKGVLEADLNNFATEKEVDEYLKKWGIKDD